MRPKPILAVVAVLASLFTTIHANAQFGIRAGGNLYNVIAKNNFGNNAYDNPKLNKGFHLGVTYDLQLGENFALQPAAVFTTKGYRILRQEETYSIQSNMRPYYIEVPLNILFTPELGNGKLILGAGPYVAYGIGGKGKYHRKDLIQGVVIADVQNADLQHVNDFADVKEGKWTYARPLDFGIQVVEGYRFNNQFYFQLMGQLGLSNLRPRTNGLTPDGRLKNIGMALSLGYTF